MPVVAPTNLLGLETLYLARGGDGGTGCLVRRQLLFSKRMRRKRRGLRARCQRGGAGGCSKSKFQKVTALHDISSFVHDG
jgi:hypothetical protein